MQPGVGVSDVARRYGVSRGLLQTWRRTAMRIAVDQSSVFVPLRIADEPPATPVEPAADSAVATAPGLIELESNGRRVRFSGVVDTAALRLVLGHFGRRN
ncbi:MAG: transposase [Janthinobacterium lividum]